MGFFSEEKYKYWLCTMADDRASCDIKMIDMKIEKEEELLEKLESAIKQYDEDIKDLKKQREEAEEDIQSEINTELLKKEHKRRTEFAKGKREYERVSYYKRYKKIKYHLTRLKDVYSRQEALHIRITDNGAENGIIISSISKLENDIHKVENFGISLSPLFIDELIRIMKDSYYDIKAIERYYIDNEISKRAIDEYVGFFRQKMGSDLGVYLAKDGEHYDVRTTDFGDWHKESPLKRYPLKEVKEALVTYEYTAIPNKGRTDCTINNRKVIRFNKDSVKESRGQP